MAYRSDTLVLTPSGWKPINEVGLTDKVAELHDGEIVFSNPVDLHSREWSGDLLHIRGRNYRMVVTPDHVLDIIDYKGVSQRIPARMGHTFPNSKMRTGACMAVRDHEVCDIKFARIVGLMKTNTLRMTRRHITCKIRVKSIRPYMEALLTDAGVPFHVHNDMFRIHRHPRIMCYFTENLRLRRSTLMALDNLSRRTFVQGAMDWTLRVRKPSFPTYICTLPPEDADLIHEVCALSGLSSTKHTRTGVKWVDIKVRPNQWNGLPYKRNVVSYSGRVYSVAVPSGILLTRVNGRPALGTDGFAVLTEADNRKSAKQPAKHLSKARIAELGAMMVNGKSDQELASEYNITLGAIKRIRRNLTT